eukprot:gene22278-25551_t
MAACSGAAPAAGEWVCGRCTLRNAAAAATCDACDATPNGALPAPANRSDTADGMARCSTCGLVNPHAPDEECAVCITDNPRARTHTLCTAQWGELNRRQVRAAVSRGGGMVCPNPGCARDVAAPSAGTRPVSTCEGVADARRSWLRWQAEGRSAWQRDDAADQKERERQAEEEADARRKLDEARQHKACEPADHVKTPHVFDILQEEDK